MELPHKSIFTQLKENKGDPLTEYKKISSLLKKFCSDESLNELLESNFNYSVLLRINYTSLRECIDDVTQNIKRNLNIPFTSLDEKTKEVIYDEFLSYCEILLHMYYITKRINFNGSWVYEQSDENTFKQLHEMIENSLKKINCKIKIIDKEKLEVAIIKSNIEAEIVAEQSPQNLRDSIIKYLAIRNSQIEEKETCILHIINLLEPIFNTRKNENILSQIKKYMQLFRHPVEKEKEKEYQWFYENKAAYLDKFFMFCIFVKEYEITKNILKEFQNLEKKDNN